MESEGFSPDDWIDLLEPFEEHPKLTPQWPDSMSSKDYLRHEDNQTGGNPTFAFGDDFIYIYLRYSPYIRAEYGTLLSGNIYGMKGLPDMPIDLFSETDRPYLSVSYRRLSNENEIAKFWLNAPGPNRSEMTSLVGEACEMLSSVEEGWNKSSVEQSG